MVDFTRGIHAIDKIFLRDAQVDALEIAAEFRGEILGRLIE